MRRKPVHPPDPIWPGAPRLCPHRAFPPVPYVPGQTPRPGSALYIHTPESGVANSNVRDEALVFGIDLYHQGYLWEAHEVWEDLWKRLGRRTPEGELVQALILLAAAMLKAHLGSLRGTTRHSRRAFDALCRLRDTGRCDRNGRLLGINVLELADAVKIYFAPLWDETREASVPLPGRPPGLDWTDNRDTHDR